MEGGKSRDYFDRIGAIKNWSLIVPFDNISEPGYSHKYGLETKFSKDAIYTGKDTMKIHWFNIDKIRNDKRIDFTLPERNMIKPYGLC